MLQDSEGNAYLRLDSYAPIRLAGLAGYPPTEGPQPSDQIADFSEIPLPDLPYQQAELEPGWYRVSHCYLVARQHENRLLCQLASKDTGKFGLLI